MAIKKEDEKRLFLLLMESMSRPNTGLNDFILFEYWRK